MKRKDFDKIIQKAKEAKEKGTLDLSTEEDLSIAIMNLISLEEHFFFTAQKTKKKDYYEMQYKVREIRKVLLARMMSKNEGESWCIAKHLLASTMRLIEVGTKLRADGKKKEAEGMFDSAYELYSLFWALRLEVVDAPELKTEGEGVWTMQDLVNRMVDCCKE